MKSFIFLSLIYLFSSNPLPTSAVICDEYTTVKTNNLTGETVMMSKEKLKIADTNRKMIFEMSFVKEDGIINYLFTANKPLTIDKKTKVKISFSDGSSLKVRSANQEAPSSGLLNIKLSEKTGTKKQLVEISSKKIETIEFKSDDQAYHLDFGGFHKNYVINTLDCLLAH